MNWNKKITLFVPVLVLSIFVSAQHLETTIKVVNGKARIAVKAVGAPITGFPNNFIFSVAIAIANNSAILVTPTVLDATRMPTGLSAIGTYADATYQYFNLFYSGNPGAAATFADGVEYELLELNWGGVNQNGPVTLISLTDGNPTAPSAPFQWLNYLEVGGTQYSFGDVLFYQSSTSLAPTQMAADYSSGTASIVTSSNILLPVNLLNFSGYKNGSKNSLKWTTANESNDLGFDVLRSTDGNSYSSIGFVNSEAPGGTSVSNISYTFDDMNPAGRKQYYRLSQKDIDGRSRLSNVISITGDKPTSMGIGGLYPNPAREQVNVIIDAPQKDDVTVVVTDMSGKTVKQKQANVDIGSNTVPIEIGGLASGSYLVKLVCQTSDCILATAKFNKQ